MPRHHDVAAEVAVVGVEPGDGAALGAGQQLGQHRPAVGIEVLRDARPVVRRQSDRAPRCPRGLRVGLGTALMPAPPARAAALALDAPAVAGQRAVGSARRGGRGSPRPAGWRRTPGPPRARAVRRADARGDLGVARGRSGRNLAQRLPDALLERRAAHVERQVEAERRRLDEADHLGDQSARTRRRRRRASRAGSGPGGRARARPGSSPSRIAHTPLALCATRIDPSEHSPTAKRIVGVGAAGAVVGRRHAQHLVGRLVEAAAGIEPGVVDRFGHGLAPLLELVADALGRCAAA